MRDVTIERQLALTLAVDLNRKHFAPGPGGRVLATVLVTADVLFEWLTKPVALLISIGPVLDQNTGQPTGTTTGGNPMQLHDNEQVDLTVTVASAKGSPIADDPATTSDDLTWTVDDDTVASLEISPDTRICTVIAGVVGSTVVTVTLGELSATLAVDVIPGAAARLTISEGTPTEQPVS